MPTQTFLLATLVALTSASPPPLSGLRTAIVGGGASGLLLAHRLLDSGATVKLIEARQDPRRTCILGPRGASKIALVRLFWGMGQEFLSRS